MSIRFTYGAGSLARKVLFAASLVLAPPVFADQDVILALGDSLTQGYGLVAEQGFVPQLTRHLTQAGHDVRIVNGGVSGDTSAGGLARVEWSLTPDVDAMIVALGGNDLLRGIDPSEVRRNIEAILKIAQDRALPVLLIGQLAPGNYGPVYKSDFDAIYPDLAKAYDALFVSSFFEGLALDGNTPETFEKVMQADGIHPNAEGVRRIVAHVSPKVQELIARIDQ